MSSKPFRVMWLLNHSSARRFEVPMLKRVGVDEVFLPKLMPNDPAFRSGSVDYSEDLDLTIPSQDLAILNRADWYGEPGRQAWEIANRYFQVVFFIAHNLELIRSVCDHFRGISVLRAYGLNSGQSYSSLAYDHYGAGVRHLIDGMGDRFYFGSAYPSLPEVEASFLASRALYLPLGMDDSAPTQDWSGTVRKLLFVCPDIGANPYYRGIYETFRRDFRDIPFSVAGAQSIATSEPGVLGFVPKAQHDANMRDYRVMFYHSQEPNHVHYHPFEAIRVGMPLVFMAGGMLDRLGGKTLPGRCATLEEAKGKIRRILDGDQRLIRDIRETQVQMLKPMDPAKLVDDWQVAFNKIRDTLDRQDILQKNRPARKPTRIAVILPVAYRGGTFRAAKLIAKALERGAQQAGTEVEIVFGYPDGQSYYTDEDLSDLPRNIGRRPFKWRVVDRATAERACTYASAAVKLSASIYQVPDDGMNQFLDCDLWFFVSDRIEKPLLPLKPYMLAVFDYLQRHEPVVPDDLNQTFLAAARGAKRVLVTSRATRDDAVQFAGVQSENVVLLPKLIERFEAAGHTRRVQEAPYFLWTTNLSVHKNHQVAMEALRQYYEDCDGTLECRMTGVDTDKFGKSEILHIAGARAVKDGSRAIRRHLKVLGHLSEKAYRAQLGNAAFLWHPATRDNGTFSVVEAAWMGVPSLSSDYPAMREMDEDFGLSLMWMNPNDPSVMAARLKFMEEHAAAHRSRLPNPSLLAELSWEHVASKYWEAVSECL